MVKFFSKRRLKIAEQIIVVSFFAVIIPMTVSGFIINNINQQSNRAQLRSAALMIANVVSEEIDVFEKSISGEIDQITETLNFYDAPEKEEQYINEICKSADLYKELAIINSKSGLSKYDSYKNDDDYVVITRPMKDGRFIVAVLNLVDLKKNLFL